MRFSRDDYESTFQVNHLAHFLIVLKLLSSMDRERGRVVLLGSGVHDPELQNPLSKLGAHLPDADEDLDQLIKPGPDPAGTEHDMGWRRYATSKLANVMFMHSLNQQLERVWGGFLLCLFLILPWYYVTNLCPEPLAQQHHRDHHGPGRSRELSSACRPASTSQVFVWGCEAVAPCLEAFHLPISLKCGFGERSHGAGCGSQVPFCPRVFYRTEADSICSNESRQGENEGTWVGVLEVDFFGGNRDLSVQAGVLTR